MKSVQNHRVTIEIGQDKLVDELRHLQQKLGLGYELSIAWLPDSRTDFLVRLKETRYTSTREDVEKAIDPLKHEFLDYIISRMMEPYERIANKLIQLTNEEVYLRKEKLTEALVKLV